MDWPGIATPAFTGAAFFGALWLYLKQKKDQKKEAAAAILMEIRRAEGKLKEIQNSSDTQRRNGEIGPVLSSNSWATNRHLLDLTTDEIDIINNFYSDCLVIDNASEQISIGKQLEHQSMAIHAGICELAKAEQTGTEVFKNKVDEFLKMVTSKPIDLNFLTLDNSIKMKAQNIKSIINTPLEKKLRKIAKISTN